MSNPSERQLTETHKNTDGRSEEDEAGHSRVPAAEVSSIWGPGNLGETEEDQQRNRYTLDDLDTMQGISSKSEE